MVRIDDLPVTLTHRFVLQNNESNAIQVETVSASCGCAQPEFPHDVIPSGQRGAGVVEITLQRRREDIKKSVTLALQDGRTIKLLLPCSVFPPVDVTDSQDWIELTGTSQDVMSGEAQISICQKSPGMRPRLDCRFDGGPLHVSVQHTDTVNYLADGNIREDLFLLTLHNSSAHPLPTGNLSLKASLANQPLAESSVIVRSRQITPFTVSPAYVRLTEDEPRYILVWRTDGRAVEQAELIAAGVKSEPVPGKTLGAAMKLKLTRAAPLDPPTSRVIDADMQVDGMHEQAVVKLVLR